MMKYNELKIVFLPLKKCLIHSHTIVSVSRFLLKSLLQYQSLTEGEILPTPSSISHPPLLPVALPPGPAAVPGQSGSHSLVPLAPTGEDGLLKKPKKERKERGRENGKEDGEFWPKCQFPCI